MRRLGILIALLLLVPLGAPAVAAPDTATVVSERAVDARLLELTVHSDALNANVGVRLLLPRDWAAAPNRRWPTLYLLHGCCGQNGYQAWTGATDVEAFTATTDALIVMPEGGPTGFYSDWWNGGPAWETFHLTELRRLVESHYRGGTARAVAGLSMGGFGALSYAARHPGMFRAAASYSGLVDTTYQGARSTNVIQNFVAQYGFDRTALWGDPTAQADVWAAHNPYDLAGRLRGTEVFLSSGNGQPGPLDPAGSGVDSLEQLIGEQNAVTATQLRSHGVHVTADFYGPGRHAWAYWQRELHASFPLLMHAIGVAF
ncbi:alpha/beta hydrolase [Kutzneria sp. NPDC052558]|uniref:alpha/beta hydrolase n=1 Tax=Kutzneria sp. NPDC052558 TaxID=3364121 RepID=UPI0037C5EC07